MSTDARIDWIELGIRITKGIKTLESITHEPKRIRAKIAALQDAIESHSEMIDPFGPELEDAAYESAWESFKTLMSIRKEGAAADASTASSSIVRFFAEGYVQGADLALSYTGGFGR